MNKAELSKRATTKDHTCKAVNLQRYLQLLLDEIDVGLRKTD